MRMPVQLFLYSDKICLKFRFSRITLTTIEAHTETDVSGILNNCNKNGSREKIPIPAIKAIEKNNPGRRRILKSESRPDPAAVCNKQSRRIIRISVIIQEEID